MKSRFTYFIGRPSWHQARAGHTCAGIMICDHTPDEHATFVARYQTRGERITWKIDP